MNFQDHHRLGSNRHGLLVLVDFPKNTLLHGLDLLELRKCSRGESTDCLNKSPGIIYFPESILIMQETEYRDIVYPWWQRVWSLYYPSPTQSPVLSAGFISWIISMSLSVLALACAISTRRVRAFLDDFSIILQDLFITIKHYIEYLMKKLVLYRNVSFRTISEFSSSNILENNLKYRILIS